LQLERNKRVGVLRCGKKQGKYYGWMEKKNGKKKKRREANVIESMI